LIQRLLALLVKTPGMKIPGVFLCLLFSLGSLADCGHPTGALLKVKRVSDGDTLKLEDGRSVRVLGINAPEIARGQKPAQPLGREAHSAAQAFIQRAGGRVRLGFERARADHYGRLLAHVYDSQGRSLAADLLQRGMVLQIAVPPNAAQSQCLLAFEQRAQAQALGVWRNRYWNAYPVKSLSARDSGFRHLRGRVARVDVNSSVWIEFEGNLVARIAKRDWAQFGYRKQDWLALKGQWLDVRGWVRVREVRQTGKARSFKPLIVQLRSPAAMQVSASR
jgi:endonuclease YncB( thermonuclease family)